ncbi:MAG TPA: hypothetical protein VEY30_11685 [Myxococcaceae bacterium]|nr:hypothetical protein [Myxococcaceae bacterium]
MNVKIWAQAAVTVVAAVGLQACGGSSICDRAGDFAENQLQCLVGEDSNLGNISDAQKEACEQQLDGCTDADKDLYENFFDCAEGAGECSTANQQEYTTKLAACSQTLSGVSPACDQAVGID